MVQSVKRPAPGFDSGRDLVGRELTVVGRARRGALRSAQGLLEPLPLSLCPS